MAKIESKVGWLRSVDTDRHTLDIKLDEFRIITVQPGERIPENLTQYKYAENIEWEDEYFYDNIGERVRFRLEDNVVIKIELA